MGRIRAEKSKWVKLKSTIMAEEETQLTNNEVLDEIQDILEAHYD